MTTAGKWRRAIVVCGVALSSAVLGFSLTPDRAEAASPAVFHWSCTGADACGAGSRECCAQYDHCSTQCTIIIQ